MVESGLVADPAAAVLATHERGAVDRIDQAIREAFILLDALDRRTLATITPALTTAQYHTLAALAQVPSQSLGDLAARRLCDKANVSGLIDRLAEQGLATRLRDPNDKRRVALSLTPQGREVLAKATRVRSAALNRALLSLQASGLGDTQHVLQRLVELLQAAVAASQDQ